MHYKVYAISCSANLYSVGPAVFIIYRPTLNKRPVQINCIRCLGALELVD